MPRILFLFPLLVLFACGGGGGGGGTPAANTDPGTGTVTSTVTITGTLSAAVSKPSSGKSAQLYGVSSWAGAALQVVDASGTVVGIGTVNADGSYSVSVPKGSNYFIRAQSGNLVLKAFVPSVTATASVPVNTTTTAEVVVLASVLGVANVGDPAVNAATAIASVNITTVFTQIEANTSIPTLAASLATEITNSYNPTATTPTIGSASTTVTSMVTTIAGTVSGSVTSTGTTTIPSPGPNQAVISGTLTAASGISVSEVANATVYVIGQEANKTTADANGKYTLVVDTSKISVVTQKPSALLDSLYANVNGAITKAPTAAKNEYGVVAQSSSKLHGKKFEVIANEKDTIIGISASLARVGSISGNAKLQGQTDHTGVMVYIPGTSFIAMTDTGGNYTIGNVPPGTYPFLRAEKSGYKYAMLSNVIVNANATTAADNMQLLLDTGAAGSIVVGTGASYITSKSTTLSIAATSSAVLMKISEDVNFIGATWESLQTTKVYTFASDGAKTIYIKFADANGLESSPFTASVVVDTSAPTVTSSSPTNNAAEVSPSMAIAVTFSEAMDSSTFTNATITLNNGATCTVTYDANTNTATCTPTNTLTFNTTYILSLSSNIKDAHGWALATSTVTFTSMKMAGVVTTLAGTAGLDITTAGTNLYVTVRSANSEIRQVTIANGTVTVAVGGFTCLGGITADGANLYVTDTACSGAGGIPGTVKKIVIATGVVSTIAGDIGIWGATDGTGVSARFNYPSGITTDGTNLYVIDNLNHTIRKIVIATGIVTTLAGTAGAPGSTDGIGAAARFNCPNGITTDGINLYVTEINNHVIRKIVIATGTVTTLAGTAGTYGSTDGIGAAARFYNPIGITTDGTSLYIADSGVLPGAIFPGFIRKVVIATGAVSTIAGDAGIAGSTDGIGAAARFKAPSGITTDGTSLYVVDSGNSLIRKIQ